jgi:cellulose synthase/poly-beta-1,6-N-acetylglucosamine synthase-like glycosyltransferase
MLEIAKYSNLIKTIRDIIFSIEFILILTSFIIVYHILVFLIRDLRYIKHLAKYKEKTTYIIDDLDSFPLINFIIPAWKEEHHLEGCINSILKLKYPNTKIIINAGGNEKTIQIANSYRYKQNFEILHQKKGEGKIKAINDCLKYVKGGIIYLIDADIFLTKDNFFQMIYHLINENEFITTSRVKPHKSIENIDIVKYIYIDRNAEFKRKHQRYLNKVSANTAIKFDAIKTIKKFPEGKSLDDGAAIGSILIDNGFKIYALNDLNVPSLTYPTNIKDYINQNLRWVENYLFTKIYQKKYFLLIRFLIKIMISIYFIISPLLIFINIYYPLFGWLIFLSLYLKKIRKILFYHFSLNKSTNFKCGLRFFLKMFLYIYIDELMIIIVIFEILFYRKNYRKRKNLI